MSISAGIDGAIASNPGILDTPGLAIDAAGSQDPATTSAVLTQSANAYSVGQSISDLQAQEDPSTHESSGGGGGFFGALSKATHFVGHALTDIPGVKGVGHALGSVAKYLGGPLHEIQRDYRFVHTVYAKDGIVAGFLTTAGLVAGAAAGTLIDNPIAGMALAAQLERTIAGSGAVGSNLRAQADLAASPEQQISFGRDVAHLIGFAPGLHSFDNTNKGIGKVASGLLDASADWVADPVIAGAKFATGLKTGDLGALAHAARSGGVIPKDAPLFTKVRGLLNGQLGVSAQYDAVKKAFDNFAPGNVLRSPEQLATLYGPGTDGAGIAGQAYRRFLDHVVSINAKSATPSADIARQYPPMANLAFNVVKDDGGNVISKGLASATTRAEAQQVMMDVAHRSDFMQRMFDSSTLPTRTVMRATTQHVAEWLRNISPETTRVDQPGLIKGTLAAGKQIATGHPVQAAGTVAAAAAGKIRTFTGMVPFAMNKSTAALSTTEIGWHDGYGLDPGGAAAAANVMRFGLGTTNGRYFLNELMNAPSIGDARRIWVEANLENFKAMGIPEGDNLDTLMLELRRQSLDYNSPIIGGYDDAYGHGYELGPDVDRQPIGDATPHAALFSHQASHSLVVPNYKDALLAMRLNKGAIKANYGKFDDIAFRRYIGPVFKTSALLNTGFALRVALAEVVPQTMRVGVWQHLKSYAATQSSRKGYLMPDAEQEQVLAAVTKALSEHPIKQTAKLLGRPLKASNTGMWRGLNAMVNDRDASQFATRLVVEGDGHIASGVAATHEAHGGYGYGDDPADRARIAAYVVKDAHSADRRIGYKDTGKYSTIGPYDKQYDAAWHMQLSKAAANTPQRYIAGDLGATDNHELAVANEEQRIRAAIHGAPEVDPAYAAESKLLTGYTNIKANNWSARDFAERRVDAMRGLLHGEDDTYHADIAAQIARGEKPNLEQISEVPFKQRPPQMIDGERLPYVGPNVAQRVAKWGYARVINPIITHISRDPIYFKSAYDEYNILKPFVDRGVLDDDTAFRLARTRGAISMAPKIHNTALRSQFSVLANNFMPFYFAQEQALKRAGRVVLTNPNALRQYQLVEQSLNNPGFVHTDAEGQKYLIFPGAGVLGNVVPSLLQNSLMFGSSMVSGLPLTVSGNLASLNTLLPEANQPGVSPLVSVPLNKLAQLFPELSPEVKDIVGSRGFNQPALSAFIPSPITRNLQNALSPDQSTAAFANAWLTAYAAAAYHGQVPPINAPKAEQDAFIARLKNNTRSTFLVKMLLGFVSPLAPNVQFEDAGLRDEFSAMVKKEGAPQAIQDFLQKHGTKAISYTVAHSQSNVPDFHNPYTNEALAWTNVNHSLIHSQFGNGAAWLIPQSANGAGDIQVIQSELLRQHLRTLDTPQDFANQVAISTGQSYISTAEKSYQAFKDANAANPTALSGASKVWSDYVNTASYNNPIWGDWWKSPDRTLDAVKAYEDLVTLYAYHGQDVTINGKRVKVPEIPAGPQTTAVGQLLEAFSQHRAALAQHPTNTVADSTDRKQLKAQWSAYLTEQAKNPVLYPVVTGLFSRLDGGLGNP